MSPFKGYPRQGYSIWGVQPGDDVENLLRGLPNGVEVDIESKPGAGISRKIKLKLGLQSLTVLTQFRRDKEVVIRLGVFGVNDSFSLERDGNRILTGHLDSSNCSSIEGARKRSGGFTVKTGKNILEIEFLTNHLVVVILK